MGGTLDLHSLIGTQWGSGSTMVFLDKPFMYIIRRASNKSSAKFSQSSVGLLLVESAYTSAFTFKTLLRHYAKRALTPRSLNVKLGPRHKSQKGQAGWLA